MGPSVFRDHYWQVCGAYWTHGGLERQYVVSSISFHFILATIKISLVYVVVVYL